MAKIKINYDKDNNIFYLIENGSQETLNIPFDDDTVVRINPKELSVVGLIISDFSTHHPKLAKSIGTKNEEFVITYFRMFLDSFNNVLEKIRDSKSKKTVFNKFVTSTKIKIKDGECVFT